ncbi:MAG: DUF5103 domain-containing protein [Muribaculaceae bacterium]|nr:DUF5103 domain-containing protein [Muribaculaceae bacterium]
MTSTAIFDPMFRTLTLTKNDDLMEDAVIGLDGRDKLVFSFDEISDDRRYLRCRLLHCNADWQPSSLVEAEYVDGFNYDQIEDFGFSQNTYIHYVNYRYEIGQGEGLQPLKSGNYLWQVYDEDDPDKVLLQARFRVSEDLYRIGGLAHGRTDCGFNSEWQQVNLELYPAVETGCNPYTDLMVEIVQNLRPDTSRMILHPQRMEGRKVVYEHLPELIFPAGNEYRRFETVRTDYPGMGIETTGYEEPMYHAKLKESAARAGRGYLYDSTQHGRYKIDEYNATDPDLGADYVMTHFTLDFPEVMDGDIYVEGDLALRGYTDVNRMEYDREDGLYHLSMPLKQGSYNYQYVILPKNMGKAANIGGNNAGKMGDASVIEGDNYETINEYNIYVYLRQPGARADRLVGAATVTARP